jgi:hypothetical protein
MKDLDPDPRFGRKFTTETIQARLGHHALNKGLVIDSEGNVYDHTGERWENIQTIEIDAPPEYNDFPLVSEGETVYTADTEDEGTIYVYENTGGRLRRRTEISDDIIGWVYDQTGSKLTGSDNTILAGSIPSTPNESTEGALTIYRRSGQEWQVSGNLRTHIEGKEILMKGNTIAVLDQSRQLRVRNIAEDWQHTITVESDVESIALASPRQIVLGLPNTGAGGEVRIYNLNRADAIHTQTLTVRESGSRQRFGADIAVTDGNLLIGAPQDDTTRKSQRSDRRTNRGAGYLFVEGTNEWRASSRILPENDVDGGHYGYEVSLSQQFGSFAQSREDDTVIHVSPLQELKA